ncbi:hypothetical protein, partial [Mycobacterium tuberculosis]
RGGVTVVCDLPVTSAAELATALGVPG